MICMGVEPKIGVNPPKWMVYNGKPYEQMDDLGGPPLFLETPVWRKFVLQSRQSRTSCCRSP